MFQDQKEVLLEDPSMTSWIRLFISFVQWEPVSGLILTVKAKILYEKLYGSGDSSVTDTSDTSENSDSTCFKAISGWVEGKA